MKKTSHPPPHPVPLPPGEGTLQILILNRMHKPARIDIYFQYILCYNIQMTGEYRQIIEDPEAVAKQAQWRESVDNVIEPIRNAYGKQYEGVLNAPSLREAPIEPEGQTDTSIAALRKETKEQYHNLFGLTRLSPKENEEFRRYLSVPYLSLTSQEQGECDILRAKAVGFPQETIDTMAAARRRLVEGLARREARSKELNDAETMYQIICREAEIQWDKLSNPV